MVGITTLLVSLISFCSQAVNECIIHQINQITDYTFLHCNICWAVQSQSRTEVDLQQPWFELAVNEDIKAKELYTVWTGGDRRSDTEEGQGDDVVDPLPQKVLIDVLAVKKMPELAHGPLATSAHSLFLSFVEGTELIDAGVGEMSVQVTQRGQIELLSGEAHKAFLMNVDSQWLEALHTRIDPQVELVARDQQRVTDVPLYNYGAVIDQLLNILKDKDPSASGEIHWFTYPVKRQSSVQTQFVVFSQETSVVVGEDEGGGTEVIES